VTPMARRWPGAMQVQLPHMVAHGRQPHLTYGSGPRPPRMTARAALAQYQRSVARVLRRKPRRLQHFIITAGWPGSSCAHQALPTPLSRCAHPCSGISPAHALLPPPRLQQIDPALQVLRVNAPPACGTSMPSACAVRCRSPALIHDTSPAHVPPCLRLGLAMLRAPACKALIHGRICPPQCTGTKYYISTRAPIHATENSPRNWCRYGNLHNGSSPQVPDKGPDSSHGTTHAIAIATTPATRLEITERSVRHTRAARTTPLHPPSRPLPSRPPPVTA
jgi:hypothetical protein